MYLLLMTYYFNAIANPIMFFIYHRQKKRAKLLDNSSNSELQTRFTAVGRGDEQSNTNSEAICLKEQTED